MQCPIVTCNKNFRQSDVLKGTVFDTLHGRSIGNNWLSTIKCPHCCGEIVVKQTVKLEVFGYDRRFNDTKKEVI